MILDSTPKRILLVGGNSGIGEEIFNTLKALKPMLGEGVSIHRPTPQELNVTSEWSIEDYFKTSKGPYTHIVYTAGVPRLAWAQDLTMDDYIHDYSVNVFGFGLVAGAHRRLFPTAPVSMVAMVSDAYRNPMRGSATYCSSKAALAALIRNLAREWAPHCRVNGIAPAVVSDTPISNYIDDTVPGFRGWDREKAAAYEASLLPMGRRITKQEVAHATCDVLFGPAYMTGSIIEITGGK